MIVNLEKMGIPELAELKRDESIVDAEHLCELQCREARHVKEREAGRARMQYLRDLCRTREELIAWFAKRGDPDA